MLRLNAFNALFFVSYPFKCMRIPLDLFTYLFIYISTHKIRKCLYFLFFLHFKQWHSLTTLGFLTLFLQQKLLKSMCMSVVPVHVCGPCPLSMILSLSVPVSLSLCHCPCPCQKSQRITFKVTFVANEQLSVLLTLPNPRKLLFESNLPSSAHCRIIKLN